MRVYESDFAVAYKEDKSPVTLADERADALINRLLSESFPDYGILSEENIENQETLDKEYCFIVDPLDGTKEFVKKNGEFGVNIALSRGGESVMGVIYLPVTREIYFASRGEGAFVGRVDERDRLGEILPLTVSSRLTNLVVTTSHPYVGDKLKSLLVQHEDKIGDIRYVGSSIKGCLIARGMADVYYRFGHTNEWDTAAMHCIVEEAGGIFRQMDGTVLSYNRINHLNEKGFYVVNRRENIWV